MKKTSGFSRIGVIAGILVTVFIVIASILVIDANNKATDYNKYDFFSVIGPDEHNGNIGDHVKGSPDAPVLIFEYADYQCEYCASMNPRVNAAVGKSDGKLAIVYRNYLLSYHSNGTAAASAVLAAGLQNYWKEYADKMFTEQSEWYYATASTRTDMFVKYFEEVTENKGDVEKFKADMASDSVSKRINFDMGIGKRLGVPGTPSFYVDGQYIDWSNKQGSEITVNGQKISWDHNLTGAELTDLLLQITEAKLAPAPATETTNTTSE